MFQWSPQHRWGFSLTTTPRAGGLSGDASLWSLGVVKYGFQKPMISADRKSDRESVLARDVSKADGPFLCPECSEPVLVRKSSIRTDHFAHAKSGICNYSSGESDTHRRCKLEIYNALLRHPKATAVFLERSLTTARPDISATINGVRVAIEVQISNLPLETIVRRTQEYARKGVYVLWLLQWTPYLDGLRYNPRLWEKWLHAAYFGRVYYWVEGLTVACYHFEPHYRSVVSVTRSTSG